MYLYYDFWENSERAKANSRPEFNVLFVKSQDFLLVYFMTGGHLASNFECCNSDKHWIQFCGLPSSSPTAILPQQPRT